MVNWNKDLSDKELQLLRKSWILILRNRGSRWQRGLRCRSAAARLLRLRVRIPPGAWMSVCCEGCVLSGRGLRDGLIIRPEESYRMWRVWVWSRNLVNEEAMAHWGGGLLRQIKKKYYGTEMRRKWNLRITELQETYFFLLRLIQAL